MEIFLVDGEVAFHILADGNGALLTVEHLKRSVILLHPVHDVERKALAQRVDNGIALGILVHKFPLILRSDIELSMITLYPSS